MRSVVQRMTMPLRAPDGDAGGAGAGAGAGAGSGGGTPWYQGVEGVDTVLTGHIQTKGWDKLDPAKAAVAAAQAHRQAEGLIGAPADQILRLPKETTDPAWNSVWQRLGRPAEEKGYDFSGVKFADGTEPDESLVNTLRSTAFKLNVPAEAASGMMRAVLKYTEDAEAAEEAERAASLQTSREALKKSWGANEAANKLIAQNAWRALLTKTGMPQEQFAEAMTALENMPGVGYVGLHQILLSIGQSIGEAKFITNTGAAGDGVMTAEQATARIAELKKDQAWVKGYLAGDATKKREMENLLKLTLAA